MEQRRKKIKCEIYRDSMQNYKKYAIPPAQLIIADVPYNIGNNFYGSNPMWYIGGDNKNGESKLAKKAAFNSDFNFNLYEYFHFCSKMLKKEPKKAGRRGRSSDAPCMIVFCSFEQMSTLINAAKKHGFNNYIPLVFVKNYSPQVLKANMRVVGATEYALVLYRDKLPKFRNGAKFDENGKTIRGTGHMVFNCRLIKEVFTRTTSGVQRRDWKVSGTIQAAIYKKNESKMYGSEVYLQATHTGVTRSRNVKAGDRLESDGVMYLIEDCNPDSRLTNLILKVIENG